MYLGVQIVSEIRDKTALDGELIGQEGQVMRQFVVRRYDDRVSGRVELRSSRSAEDL